MGLRLFSQAGPFFPLWLSSKLYGQVSGQVVRAVTGGRFKLQPPFVRKFTYNALIITEDEYSFWQRIQSEDQVCVYYFCIIK
jgi:hypothetical protein